MSDQGDEADPLHVASPTDRADESRQSKPYARSYHDALEPVSGEPPGWARHAHALLKLGYLAEAAAAYRRALDDNPANASVHLQLGRVLSLQGRKDEAVLAYLRAFLLDPVQSDPMHAELGWPAPKLEALQSMLDGIGNGARALPRSMRNPGVSVLNNAPANGTATIIVVGLPRSGTSMVAAVLDSLGVHLGSLADQAVFEDLEIITAIEHDRASLPDIIDRYNESYRIWGFKYPSFFEKGYDKLHLFRNPRLIIIFRDPLAIAMRNAISMKEELLLSLDNTSTRISNLVEFTETLRIPTLMASYEKALIDPSRLINSIINFSGVAPTADQVASATKVVVSGPELYLQNSQMVPWEGYLDQVSEDASGWARLVSTKDPATVIVKIDGVEVGRGLADKPRPDLALLGKGDVGFSIPLPQKPAPGANIEVYINEVNQKLRRSRG
jgi:tetratricopeptide (TPR) repeat protein